MVRYPLLQYTVSAIATASAAATPARADVRMPCQFSGLSSEKTPALSASLPSRAPMKSPGRAAASMPAGSREVIFMRTIRDRNDLELSRVGHRKGNCGSTPAPDRLSGTGVVAIAGARARASGGLSDVGSNGLAARLRAGGPHLRAAAGDGRVRRQALVNKETKIRDIALGQCVSRIGLDHVSIGRNPVGLTTSRWVLFERKMTGMVPLSATMILPPLFHPYHYRD